MFDMFRRARADLATMNALFPAAENIARRDGVDQPGAEHLLLAACELDDGIAKAALGAFKVDSARLEAALVDQHEEALRAVGVAADESAIAASMPDDGKPTGPYRAQGSLQTAFQQAVRLSKRDKSRLNSGYVLLATIEADHGTLARSLAILGVDRDLLRASTRNLVRLVD